MAAKEQTQGYKLDKNHTFAVNLFDDIEKYARVPDEYQAPPAKEFKALVRDSTATVARGLRASCSLMVVSPVFAGQPVQLDVR